jgi:hypothetical protein
MSKFEKGNALSNGRPIGSKNKRGKITDTIADEALRQLELAVFAGETWAINEVLKRLTPTLKAVTPEDSLDGKYLALKMKEISEFEERLTALEAMK